MTLLSFDKKHCNGFGLIGVDEAGRGALYGPVVAAAVWISPQFYNNPPNLEHFNDSKKLDETQRAKAYEAIFQAKDQGLLLCSAQTASAEEVDTLNILGATKRAMNRCLHQLKEFLPDHEGPLEAHLDLPLWEDLSDGRPPVLIDGPSLKGIEYAHSGIVKGDSKSLAIAMASIVAKVTRDTLLIKAAEVFPGYGFESHKGYATKEHKKALTLLGPLSEHRQSFLAKHMAATTQEYARLD